MTEWSVRVMVYVDTQASAEYLVKSLSDVLAKAGHGGAWGGNADPPAADQRTLGALLHVHAPRVGLAAEQALDSMRRACAEAGIVVHAVEEVTVSAPLLSLAARQRN